MGALTQRWIGVDWGTTQMRAWIMEGERTVTHIDGGAGMNALSAEGFEPELVRQVEPHLHEGCKTPVVICGMAGARQGWAEATYLPVPTEPIDVSRAIRVETNDARMDVHILPGLSQSSPPDVMRGEETQIAGYLASDPEFDGVLCLPGTHNKWVHISAGEVVSFRTAMTGELYDLLSHQSVLRHSVADGDWDAPTFLAAVDGAMSRPAALASDLFAIRARDLSGQSGTGTGAAQLSGLLIGVEMAAMRPYWLGQRIVLIGEPGLAGHYQAALSAQGAMVETTDAQDLTLKGLIAAYYHLTGGI